MIQKRQLLVNAVTSVIQVIVVGLSLFVLYRLVKDWIGIELFGVWSLVLATTTASRLADLGLATSTVKFVSKHLAHENVDRVSNTLQTAALSIGLFLAVVLPALYPLFVRVIQAAVEPSLLDEALSVLPYAVAAFWLTSVAMVFQGGLDGHQRIDLRNGLLVATALLYVVLAFLLVPTRGLLGLAQAQVVQSGFLFVASWFLLRRVRPQLPWMPYRWRRDVFTEMFSYSFQFQIVSLLKLLFEPLTKVLVMAFGGAAPAGYFEFAHRMVFQLRALVVTAHQSVVPTIADLQERAPDLIRTLYTTSLRVIVFLILLTLPFCILATPLVSYVWIGAVEPVFVEFSVLIFAGWFLNMLANPAYFAFMGIGRLRWNLTGYAVMGALNAGLGFGLGPIYGGMGVVIAFVISLVVGSFVIAVAYHLEYGVDSSVVVDRPSRWLAAAGLAGLLAGWACYRFAEGWTDVQIGIVVLSGYLLLVAWPAWNHPARSLFLNWWRLGLGGMHRTGESPS